MMKRRASIAVLLVGLICAGSATLAPRPAYALFGVGDIVLDPTNLVQNTISATAAAKNLLNPVFYAIAQATIQSMVRSTVNWINSGFQGSPAYATDLQSTLQDAADQVANGFVRDLTNNLALNSPFRDGIAQSVLQAYYLSTSKDGFALANPYTLNQVSPDDAAFLRGDFTKGGFQAWFSAVLNPQNNPIGAQNALNNALLDRVATARGQIHEELGWGSGIFSYRKCDATATTLEGSGNTTVGANGTTQVDLTPHQTCLSSHIETPGSVIAGNINHALGLGADSLVQAKEFDEIVNALMAQLMGQVLGPSGLGGLSQGSAATGGRGYFNQTSTSASTVSAGVSAVSAFLQVVDSQSTQLQTYLANWQTISTAANAAKTAVQASTCMLDAEKQAVLDAQIQPTITEAATAIGEVPNDLTTLDHIKQQVLTTVTADAGTQTTTLQQAASQYQTLLASNTMPSAADFTNASQQAQDTGSTTPASLFTQMNQLTAQAKCGG